ncbi:MAG: ABC transporter ATP-binding protein [Ilumatobacteraceae bacterium]
MTGVIVARRRSAATDDIGVWRLVRHVAGHEPRSTVIGTALFAVFFTLPALIGWLLSRAFGAISDGELRPALRWAALLVVVEIVRMVSIHAGAIVWTRAWIHMQTFLRANLLAAQLASGGPQAGRPVTSAGESIAHFRDDAEDVANLVDGLVDLTGGVTFTIVAAFVLGGTDVGAAAALVVPLVAVGVVTKLLDSRIKTYRAADRTATGHVTSFVGDVMAAATTVKVNGADGAVLDRLRRLIDVRRRTAVRDRVLEEGVMAFSRGAADVGLGLVLLIGAPALASGAFGVEQLALFVTYLAWLSFMPRMVGRVLARRKQAAVAFGRMRGLVADGDERNTVLPRDLPIARHQIDHRVADVRPERASLASIELIDVEARYESGAGVGPVSLAIGRGEFVVLTGPVGAGKSTLLRAVLGLASPARLSGEVRWNGELLIDRAAFLVPPNAAFLPQVPQLVSDTLADNVSLGDVDDEALAVALELAELSADVARMVDGTATMIGPRGLRLSGGQRQRLAAARAIVRRPELVVLDDLSRALDVETEIRLWDRFAAADMTVLAVSHRAVAFERASRVLRLDAGGLTGPGVSGR